MNFNNYTIKAQEAVQQAQQIATTNQNQAIETAHLVKGIMAAYDNVLLFLTNKLGIDFNTFEKGIDSNYRQLSQSAGRRAIPFEQCFQSIAEG